MFASEKGVFKLEMMLLYERVTYHKTEWRCVLDNNGGIRLKAGTVPVWTAWSTEGGNMALTLWLVCLTYELYTLPVFRLERAKTRSTSRNGNCV